MRKEAALILRNEGISGLYKGFWITLMRDVPAWGSFFYIYDLSKRYFAND